MNDLHCTLVRRQLEDLLDGYLSAAGAATMERHLAKCRGCAAQLEAAKSLRQALQALPVPELSADFAAAALAEAARRNAPAGAAAGRSRAAPPGRSAPRRGFELWLGAAIGAAATAALMVVLLGLPQSGQPPMIDEPAGVSLALHEVREIGVAIDIDTAITGAVMTVLLEGGIDLVGFGEQRELSWQTDLDAGTNVLSLPILAHSIGDGRLTALLRHGSMTRRIDLSVSVAPPALN